MCLVGHDFRGEWSCRFSLAHGHFCEHCHHLVQVRQRVVATVLFRNGVQSVNYLAHERCHDVRDQELFGSFLKGEADEVPAGD